MGLIYSSTIYYIYLYPGFPYVVKSTTMIEQRDNWRLSPFRDWTDKHINKIDTFILESLSYHDTLTYYDYLWTKFTQLFMSGSARWPEILEQVHHINTI